MATSRNNASFLHSGVNHVFGGSLHGVPGRLTESSTFWQTPKGSLDMTTAKLLLLNATLMVAVVGSLLIGPRAAHARQDSGAAHDGASPTVESVGDTLAFISWTTPNPGGTTLHYAVVRFRQDRNHLEFTVKSPTRINPSHSQMIFRVRIQDLDPGT